MARDWFLASLEAKGISTEGAIAKHFVAVSTALDKVAEFGIDPQERFRFLGTGFGGRYSVDSAVGTVLAVAVGPETSAISWLVSARSTSTSATPSRPRTCRC